MKQDPENPNDNRREHFRMRLEPGYELRAIISGRRCKLTEVSERGLRVAGANVPDRDGKCDGVVVWSDGRRTDFSGTVDRIHSGETVIIDVQGIDMSDIVDEQRRANRSQKFRVVRND